MEIREELIDILLGGAGDFPRYRQLADRTVADGVQNAPVDIAVPDIAGQRLGFADGAIEAVEHGVAKVGFQREIHRIEQIVFSGEVAKKRAFRDARITGYQGGGCGDT